MGSRRAVTYLDRTTTFIRWHAADDDTGLAGAVERGVASDAWQDVFDITLGGRYVLLDSAARGDEAGGADVIRVDVPRGRYRVPSPVISPSENASFMVERPAVAAAVEPPHGAPGHRGTVAPGVSLRAGRCGGPP
ncbi:immunity 21 family protein [Streptomyces sp. NBC_01511]|uniref:Imm21 family immunity protein n=1 Tax=Streptomyces sp. NBC_01511 TaxID=2903889 RepID=UPI003864A2C4